jgi:hypothetical protein
LRGQWRLTLRDTVTAFRQKEARQAEVAARSKADKIDRGDMEEVVSLMESLRAEE